MEVTHNSAAQAYIIVLSWFWDVKFDRMIPRSKGRRTRQIISAMFKIRIVKISFKGSSLHTHIHRRGFLPHFWRISFSSCHRVWSFSVRALVLFSSSFGRRSDFSKGRQFPVLKVSVIQWNDKSDIRPGFSLDGSSWLLGTLSYLPLTGMSETGRKFVDSIIAFFCHPGSWYEPFFRVDTFLELISRDLLRNNSQITNQGRAATKTVFCWPVELWL